MYKVCIYGLGLLLAVFLFGQTSSAHSASDLPNRLLDSSKAGPANQHIPAQQGWEQAQNQDQGEVDTAGNRIGAPTQTVTATAETVVPSALNAIKILCYTTETGDGDPCARVAGLFTDVTIVRSITDIPSNLSPFDVFYLGYGEGDTLSSLSSTFVSYVNAGGGLIVEQPNLVGTISVYPPGFEMTVTDITWPGFPSSPGAVEFTASGATHPILNGLGPTDISGNFDTVPLSLIGPGWTVLVKSVANPQVALAVGRYGAGRLVFHSGNISDAAIDQGSDAYVRQMIEWAGASDVVGPDMHIDALEVTQAIQDLNNSVDLVANKRTFVRVHVSSPTNAPNVFASLAGARGSVSLYPTLSPGNPGTDITVRTSPNRGLLNDSYWFELPNNWTNAGSLTLTARLDPADAQNDPNRANNIRSVTVNFLSTPPLRLRLVDVRYTEKGTTYLAANSHLDQLESWLRRAYPINSLQVTRQTFDYPVSGLPDVDTLHAWLALGKILRELFTGEDSRVVYYGMVDDGGGFMRGKALNIPSTIAAGPTGTSAFSWDTDGSYGDWYGGHEIGHTRNRYHAEFCGATGGQAYPYPDGRISQNLTGATALFGFDPATHAIYNPSTWRDVMTYCANQWISDFTYEGIRNYLVTDGVAKAAAQVVSDRYLVVLGMADLVTNTAELKSVYLINQSQTTSLPQPGDWTLALQNVNGADLATYAFAPLELTDGETSAGRPAVIALVVPASDGLAKLEIRHNNNVVVTRSASVNPPTVTITVSAPALDLPSVAVASTLNVTWTASDPDGDPLSFSLLYSNNNGESWQTLAAGLTEHKYAISSDQLPGGQSALVRVLVSDGFLSASATSAPFSMPQHAPEVKITSPTPSATFWPGQNVVLEGSAYDLEDHQLADAALVWSSNIDGVLATGTLSNTVNLSTGEHILSLTATDSSGMQSVAQVSIVVVGGDTPKTTLLNYDPNALSHVVFRGGKAATFDLAMNSSNDTELAWNASASESWISLDVLSGTEPSLLKVTLDPTGLKADTYTGTVTLKAPLAANSPITIPVTLEVVEPATLNYTPTALNYTVFVNGQPSAFDIDLSSSNKISLGWQATVDQTWLSLDVVSGTVPSKLKVTINPTNLAAGVYKGTIKLQAPSATNSAVDIPITLTVKAHTLYLPMIRH